MSSPASLSNLHRFVALTGGERRLLLEAWWRLLAAAVRLHLAPRRTLAAALAGALPQAAGDGASASIAQPVALAVARAAAHHFAPMTCLPRALALQKMLAKRGIASTLRIGVRKAAATIDAHAWVEVEGRALGEPATIEERYRALLPAAPTSGPKA